MNKQTSGLESRISLPTPFEIIEDFNSGRPFLAKLNKAEKEGISIAYHYILSWMIKNKIELENLNER